MGQQPEHTRYSLSSHRQSLPHLRSPPITPRLVSCFSQTVSLLEPGGSGSLLPSLRKEVADLGNSPFSNTGESSFVLSSGKMFTEVSSQGQQRGLCPSICSEGYLGNASDLVCGDRALPGSKPQSSRCELHAHLCSGI